MFCSVNVLKYIKFLICFSTPLSDILSNEINSWNFISFLVVHAHVHTYTHTQTLTEMKFENISNKFNIFTSKVVTDL